MQYFGGKAKIAKKVVSELKKYRKEGQLFVEPFCGGLNITALIGGESAGIGVREDETMITGNTSTFVPYYFK